MSTQPRFGWFGLGAVILTALACSLSNPTPAAWALTPTAEAAAEAGTSAVQTRAAAANQAPPITTLTPTSPPEIQTTLSPPPNHLNVQGPWLVYPTEEGRSLTVRNADGSGQTRLPLPDPLIDAGDLLNGMAPHGGWLAVRTGRRADWGDLAIQLIHLPDGHILRLSPLLSPAVQKDNLVIQSVVWRDALRWSPDGRYLAFIAAVDGSSSDLYVYDLVADKLQRMTSGSNQAATPFWTPDSLWVITQEMDGLTTSATIGWDLTTVWAVNISTQEIRKLYDPPPDSDGELFLGWYTPGEIALYSQGSYGAHNLRLLDLEKLKMTPIFPGVFSQMAYDPATKDILYTLKEDLVSATGASPGLYELHLESNESQLIQAGEWATLNWSGQTHTFIANGPQGTMIINPNGNLVLFKNEPNGLPSPNSKWQASWGETSAGTYAGLRLYQPTGQILQTILNEPVQDVSWMPDSTGFFVLAGGHLYSFAFPGLQPVLLEDNINQGPFGGFFWVSD